jgi:glutaredoxin
MVRLNRLVFGLLVMSTISAFACNVLGADVLPDVVMFSREGCNDCRLMDEVLTELREQYPELVVVHIDERDAGAADLMWSLSAKYGIFPSTFPIIFVGDQGIVGIGRDKELLLRTTVRGCVLNGCESPIGKIQDKPFPWVMIAVILAAVIVLATLLL